jgi:nicotinamide riboside transporter PnuC
VPYGVLLTALIMAPNFFRILLVIVVLYVLLRGQRDERQVGLILVAGVIATKLALTPVHERFATIEIYVMLVDLAVLVGFVWVALRSERFWPLWIAGLQLTTVLGHLLKGIESDLFPRAYAAALYFWVYPILVILFVGTWRSHRRALDERDARAA